MQLTEYFHISVSTPPAGPGKSQTPLQLLIFSISGTHPSSGISRGERARDINLNITDLRRA